MRSFLRFITISTLSLAALACSGATQTSRAPQLLVQFDAAAGELPEGLALAGDTAYVGFAPSSQIVRVALASGQTTPFGTLPVAVAGKGFMTGLAISAAGQVYAGLASFDPQVQPGIYRVPAAGGAATLFASHEALAFPNALAFDGSGALWVTDSGSGSVFRVDAEGRAERWAQGALLTGDKDACGGAGPGFAIGANGLVVESDAVYVVNMDQATLVAIPRDGSGAAGEPRLIAGPDCAALGGADGLARAADGAFVVALNRQDKLVRVTAAGVIDTLAAGAPLDFPATVVVQGERLVVTNFALLNASAGKPSAPGLVELAP